MSWAEPPTGSAGIVHLPVAASKVVPVAGVAETKVEPAGTGLEITTEEASSGPLLVAVTVKVTSAPTSGAVGAADTASAMSALCPTVAPAGGEVTFCPMPLWPLAVAVLVNFPVASRSAALSR